MGKLHGIDYTNDKIFVFNCKDSNTRNKQKQAGMKIIYWNTYSRDQILSMLYKREIEAIIVYKNDSFKYYTRFLNTAAYNGIGAYIVDNGVLKDYMEDKAERAEEQKTMPNAELRAMQGYCKVAAKDKQDLYKYITLYELDTPYDEATWLICQQQIMYYLKNNIEYAYDKNMYELCEECNKLYAKDTEHECYAETVDVNNLRLTNGEM